MTASAYLVSAGSPQLRMRCAPAVVAARDCWAVTWLAWVTVWAAAGSSLSRRQRWISLDEVEEFLTGVRTGADPDRMLTTLLFTDIVNSTMLAAQLEDQRWQDVLDQHYELGRGGLTRFGGREVVTTGDGFFAAFDRPIAAVRCALSMVEAMRSLSLQIRAGVHTGEVEVRGADLGGLAAHIAALIAGARW